ncbi:Protein ssh4 [Yarrowia sp. E02]|nr:Protein ssh4 [Yarrowia sp. E02]
MADLPPAYSLEDQGTGPQPGSSSAPPPNHPPPPQAAPPTGSRPSEKAQYKAQYESNDASRHLPPPGAPPHLSPASTGASTASENLNNPFLAHMHTGNPYQQHAPPPGPLLAIRLPLVLPLARPPPGHHAPPQGPPPGHMDNFAPPPGPPPGWNQAGGGDDGLPPSYPPPRVMEALFSEANEDELIMGDRFTDNYPLEAPRILTQPELQAVKSGNVDFRLVEAKGFRSRLSKRFKGEIQYRNGSTYVRSQPSTLDSILVSALPLRSPSMSPVPKIYFEVKITSMGHPEECSLAVGFCCLPYPHFRMPGWHRGSLAVHSDDGHRYVNDSTGGQPFTHPFSVGETIGMGIDFEKQEAYMIRNGQFDGSWKLSIDNTPRDSDRDFKDGGIEGINETDVYATIGVFGEIGVSITVPPTEDERSYNQPSSSSGAPAARQDTKPHGYPQDSKPRPDYNQDSKPRPDYPQDTKPGYGQESKSNYGYPQDNKSGYADAPAYGYAGSSNAPGYSQDTKPGYNQAPTYPQDTKPGYGQPPYNPDTKPSEKHGWH